MARIDNFNNFATDVADSIRSMTGKTGKIPASQFDTEIKSIETKEDLDAELNTYNTEVTEQGVSINTIMSLLEGKAAGSGEGETVVIDATVYSTEERVVGKWIDNKPLYRKTLEASSTITSTSSLNDVVIDHEASNVDVIFLGDGGFVKDSSGTFHPINSANHISNTSVQVLKTVVNKTRIWTSISAGMIPTGDVLERVTIYYTKTTDVATDEDLGSLNFSTDEQSIGTDIDGSVLYQKTIVADYLPFITNYTNINNSIPHGITNVKNIYITNYSFLFCTADAVDKRTIYPVNTFNYYADLGRQYIRTKVDKTNITQTVGNWMFPGSNNICTRVTLRYTKTA